MKYKILMILAVLLSVTAGLSARELDQKETVPLKKLENIQVRQTDLSGVGVIVGSYRTTINVVPKRGGDIDIHLHGEAVSNNRKNIPSLVIDNAGRTLNISIDYGKRVGFFLMRRGEVILDVEIPESYKGILEVYGSSARVNVGVFELSELAVKTSSGDQSVEKITAEKIGFRASSGDLKLGECTADDLSINTSSGKIKADTLNTEKGAITATSGEIRIGSLMGTVKVQASSGDIRVQESAGDLTAEASSGDIRFLQASGAYDVEASSGEVELDFGGTRGEARVRTSSGSISVQDLIGKADLSASSGEIECTFAELTGNSSYKDRKSVV